MVPQGIRQADNGRNLVPIQGGVTSSGQPTPGSGQPNAMNHPVLQAEDNGLTGDQPVMAYHNGQPVYYGTAEAKALALRGLQNVAAAHGTNGPAWAAAVKAALGVLGPDFQAPAGSFAPNTLSLVKAQQMPGGYNAGAIPPHGQSAQLRAALAARLAMGAGGGL